MFVEKVEVIDIGVEVYDGLPDVVGQAKIENGEHYSCDEYDFQSLFHGEEDYNSGKDIKIGCKRVR